MSEIMDFLGGIDDEYLIGLTNKGIVKRSHKDLESESVSTKLQGEEIEGRVGDALVTLRMPLTKSTCSCPSASICKHIIMTILVAKEACEGQGGAGVAEEARTQDGAAGEVCPQDEAEGEVCPQDETTKESTPQADGSDAGGKVIKSQTTAKLMALSFEEIKKAVPSREWKTALTQALTAAPVKMEEGSLITVYGGEGLVVKLSYPLTLSTCNACHDEKFCRHKAWALLSFLLQKGSLSSEQLTEVQEEETEEWDEENLREVFADLMHLIEEMLLVGCARLSPETPYSLERFAIRCHGAGLALLEGKLRALSALVKGYQERKANVNVQSILHAISQCHGLVEGMEKAMEEGRRLSQTAGSFRSEYEDIPDKELLGVGMRQFSSTSGFEGHIIYFLEKGSGKYYTYSVARPTIYEKSKRSAYVQNEVPWGLPCTLTQLSKARIILKHGKVNAQGRLSSTGAAQAELLCLNAELGEGDCEFIYDDFEQLWMAYRERLSNLADGQAGVGQEPNEVDKLFLIRPREIHDMHYDETRQRLEFSLSDDQGRRLFARLAYSKQEEVAIRSLERMEKNLKQKGGELPVFLGSLYVEDGECILYPIETLEVNRG